MGAFRPSDQAALLRALQAHASGYGLQIHVISERHWQLQGAGKCVIADIWPTTHKFLQVRPPVPSKTPAKFAEHSEEFVELLRELMAKNRAKPKAKPEAVLRDFYPVVGSPEVAPVAPAAIPAAAVGATKRLVGTLRQIVRARDCFAEYGVYPKGTVGMGQCFDDWAADLAAAALQSIDDVRAELAR